MDSANLLVALLLPWLSGSLLIKLVADRFARERYGLAIHAGYGLLLGQILVAALLTLQDVLGFGIGFLFPLFSLEAIGLVAGWLIYRGHQGHQLDKSRDRALDQLNLSKIGWMEGLLIIGLLLLLGVHVVPSVAEVFWRPLFPWDAWTTWGARAKVWFHLGELVPFVSAEQWLAQPNEIVYSINAYSYPTQVSLSQTWIALSLGYWNDALTNLPWLLCGLAISLILYGQARVLGLRSSIALLLCYLLLSIPIIQTHISLAGYADLWQAAYTSAALSGLLAGWMRRDGFMMTLGFAFALAGLWIKVEGAVWLLLFGFIWGMLYLRRAGWIALTGLLMIGLLAWYINGDLALEIPAIGTLGVVKNVLHLPGLVPMEIIYHDVWWALIGNFFLYGSWNLFWYLYFITLAVSFVPPFWKIAQDGVLFMWVPLVAIMFIFMFSANAAWADDFTAINRLFIHFVPLWLLTIAVLLSRFHDEYGVKK